MLAGRKCSHMGLHEGGEWLRVAGEFIFSPEIAELSLIHAGSSDTEYSTLLQRAERARTLLSFLAMSEMFVVMVQMIIELIALLIELFALTLDLMAEAVMMLAEFVLMLCGRPRKFKRLKLRRPRAPLAEMTPRQKLSRQGAVCIAVFLLVVFAGYAAYEFSTRTIRVTAEDGTPAALAKFVWEKKNETRYARTDLKGRLKVPRFGVKDVRIEDRRYEPRTWKGALPNQVLLNRTPLGKTADAFLSPARGK